MFGRAWMVPLEPTAPLKRAGTVDEVAASILFLASPAARYITGATLRLDGGQALDAGLARAPPEHGAGVARPSHQHAALARGRKKKNSRRKAVR